MFLKWGQSGVLRMFCECEKNASVGLKVLAGITKEKEIAVWEFSSKRPAATELVEPLCAQLQTRKEKMHRA